MQATIAQRLAALRSLRTLRAHLETPPSTDIYTPPQALDEERPVARRYFNSAIVAALYRTAEVLGNTLSQPGIRLRLLEREDYGAAWSLFHLVRKQDGAQGVYVELDRSPDSVSV